MRERQRERHFDDGAGGDGHGDGGQADALRREGEQFADAAYDAIDRALSGDSGKFLSAMRQEGGQ